MQNDNQMGEINANKKRICVLSDKKVAELEQVHVTYECRMKLLNQTMESELAAAQSKAHMKLTLNKETQNLTPTSRWTSCVGIKNALSKTLAKHTETDGETEANQTE